MKITIFPSALLASIALLQITSTMSKEVHYHDIDLLRKRHTNSDSDKNKILVSSHLTVSSGKSIESIASSLCSPTKTKDTGFKVHIGESKVYCDSKNAGLLANAATTAVAEDLGDIERAFVESGELGAEESDWVDFIVSIFSW